MNVKKEDQQNNSPLITPEAFYSSGRDKTKFDCLKKSYKLREQTVPYGGNFTHKNSPSSFQNTYFWDDII